MPRSKDESCPTAEEIVKSLLPNYTNTVIKLAEEILQSPPKSLDDLVLVSKKLANTYGEIHSFIKVIRDLRSG